MVHDRIHLKTTHFLYAKHLESMGETVEAVKHYELSQVCISVYVGCIRVPLGCPSSRSFLE
jgi:hypothetical protein